MRRLTVLLLLLLPLVALAAEPAAPRRTVDTDDVPNPARVLRVAEGGNLQAALDEARPGDQIALAPGAVFTGAFVLPAKQGNGWIVVRTDAPEGDLPPRGTRLTPDASPGLAKILAAGKEPALQTAPGAHHWRILGVEIALAPSVPKSYGLVAIGTFDQTAPEAIPHHIVLDRVYVHGRPDANVRRGVAMNGADAAVIDSTIAEIHEAGADAQAIGGSTGPGPFKIVNNTIEGSGENVMFGGADPKIRDLVPSDIEIRGNHVVKPLTWMKGHPSYAGTEWTVKNLLELKNARRVVIDGNLFEQNWAAQQKGFGIVFTVRNQDGGAPWSVVEDVAFTNNVVRRVGSAINVLGTDDIHPSRPTQRILIRNNLFEDVGGPWGGKGRFLQLVDGTSDVVVERNTVAQTGEIVAVSGRPHARFVFRDNVAPQNEFGIAGDDHYGDPMGTLAAYCPGASVTGNVIEGGDPKKYPKGNAFKKGGAKGADARALSPALAAGKRSRAG
jgi:hypothetical protein